MTRSEDADEARRAEAAGLVAAGELAAFHGSPLDGVEPLRAVIGRPAGRGDRARAGAADLDRARWLLGVCLGAAGRYGPALDALAPLLAAVPARTGPAGPAALPALAAATAASLHRQLGRHAAARTLDQHALDLTGPALTGTAAAVGALPDLLLARFDAELGLAADAVGLGDRDAARAHLEGADAVLAAARRAPGRRATPDDGWRQEVRLGWVRAEVALLSGRADLAVPPSRAALAAAEAAGAPRHVAKSALFLGVALKETSELARARAALRRAAALAAAVGARPLVWPAHAVLAELERADAADPAAAEAHRRAAADVVRAIAADLPPELAGAWLARPDLRALLGGG